MSNCIKELIHNNIFYNYKQYEQYKNLDAWEQNCKVKFIDFLRMIKEKSITNKDGFGLLLYRNRLLEDSRIFLMSNDLSKSHVNFNGYNIHLTLLYEIFHNDVDILWYNK